MPTNLVLMKLVFSLVHFLLETKLFTKETVIQIQKVILMVVSGLESELTLHKVKLNNLDKKNYFITLLIVKNKIESN